MIIQGLNALLFYGFFKIKIIKIERVHEFTDHCGYLIMVPQKSSNFI